MNVTDSKKFLNDVLHGCIIMANKGVFTTNIIGTKEIMDAIKTALICMDIVEDALNGLKMKPDGIFWTPEDVRAYLARMLREGEKDDRYLL